MRTFSYDAQAALNFAINQLSYIEPQVTEIVYPDIQYPQLIPIDTSAPEWVKSITYFSSDKVGKAEWFHARSKDFAFADVLREKHEVGVELANIGYDYDIEEINQAMQLGQNLPVDRAAAAKRAYEEFVDGVALTGDAGKGYYGLNNYPGITVVMASDTGNGGSTAFEDKDADDVLTDINNALLGVYTGSNTVEMADTILMSDQVLGRLAVRRIPDTTMTILTFLQQNNVYSFKTGRPLMIRAVRGLDNAGTGGTGRMIVYRRDPQVLKMHIPMPHRFLPVWPATPLVFAVPGIFRLGGVEIKRPASVRYIDGVSEAAYE